MGMGETQAGLQKGPGGRGKREHSAQKGQTQADTEEGCGSGRLKSGSRGDKVKADGQAILTRAAGLRRGPAPVTGHWA